jgi:nicotinamidase-related amidase
MHFMGSGLFDIPIGDRAVHLCLDMQNIFAPDGLWATAWMPRVLPVVVEIASRFPRRTIFTRFVTPPNAESATGAWRRYYARWAAATQSQLAPDALDLVPALARLAVPEFIVDKSGYSAFTGPRLPAMLAEWRTDTLIITGAKTDVCVLATVLDAVDLGFRVIVVSDGVCSSSDAGHDALMQVFHGRFSQQIETVPAERLLASWNP